MRKLTARASVYLVLAIIGILFALYSIKLENYALLVIAVLFAFVSAENIFCSIGKIKLNAKNKQK